MVDLHEVNELMDWINAVNEFRNYGSVKQLTQIFKEHKEWNLNLKFKNIKSNKDEEMTLEDLFKQFDYGTNTNNLAALDDSIEKIKELSDKIENSNKLPKQAKVLLENISEDFKMSFKKNMDYPYSNLTIQLALWFYKQDRIGNAAIALQEGIETYVFERFEKQSDEIAKSSDSSEWTLKKDAPKFEHSYREKVKEQVWTQLNGKANHKGYTQKDRYNDFVKKQDGIRNNIRNVNAHIGYKKKDYKTYNNDIQTIMLLANMIFEDMKKNSSDSIFGFVEDMPYKYAKSSYVGEIIKCLGKNMLIYIKDDNGNNGYSYVKYVEDKSKYREGDKLTINHSRSGFYFKK